MARNEREPDRANRDEDTEAILSRREFLIKAALAAGGVSAALVGCGKAESRPCLSIAKPCLTEVAAPPPEEDKKPPEGDEEPADGKKPDAPQPCLRPPPPDKVEKKEGKDGGAPEPCLSPPPLDKSAAPKGKDKPEAPKVCLSLRIKDD